MVWDALSLITGIQRIMEAMAGLVSVLGICAIPCALTAELPKLDMNNGPTVSG